MGRFLKVAQHIMVFLLILVGLFVVADLARFATRYHNYWKGQFTAHEVFHEQQIVAAHALISQEQWARQADYNLSQLQQTHHDLVMATRRLKAMEKEHYHFMRTLEEIDPEALEKTLERIKQPRLVIPFLNIPLNQECEDGQCQENFSN